MGVGDGHPLMAGLLPAAPIGLTDGPVLVKGIVPFRKRSSDIVVTQ